MRRKQEEDYDSNMINWKLTHSLNVYISMKISAQAVRKFITGQLIEDYKVELCVTS